MVKLTSNPTSMNNKSEEATSTTQSGTDDQDSTNREILNFHENFQIDDSGVLQFDKSSSLKPKNWPSSKKLKHTILYGIITFSAQLNSTTMSASIFPDLVKSEFGIQREVALLTTTLYIMGIAFGPMIFAPLSEVYGRKLGVLIPVLVSGIFTFAVASTYNVAGMMICRFFAGFFAGAPIVSAGGVLADIWEPAQRGTFFALYACFVASGPAFGPTISSLLMHSEDKAAAWRIPQYFSGLLTFVLFFVSQFISDETYEPLLLTKNAKQLRINTGNWSIHSKHEEWTLTWDELVKVHFIRPFKMLVQPIVFVIALFASYVYGIFYLIITTMPEAFSISRGWYGTVTTLPNISLFGGVLVGCSLQMLATKRYARLLKANNGVALPEERFSLMIFTAWMMPAGIFIFGWTSSSDIHWIVPCIGIWMIGTGFITIFQGSLNYLVDAYTKYSASVIAANTFLRSVFAASFPLFSKQLFDNLGVHWGASLIGFIALGMLPIPYLFFKYGAKIRAKSNPSKLL